jgi:hypothetical protein
MQRFEVDGASLGKRLFEVLFSLAAIGGFGWFAQSAATAMSFHVFLGARVFDAVLATFCAGMVLLAVRNLFISFSEARRLYVYDDHVVVHYWLRPAKAFRLPLGGTVQRKVKLMDLTEAHGFRGAIMISENRWSLKSIVLPDRLGGALSLLTRETPRGAL